MTGGFSFGTTPQQPSGGLGGATTGGFSFGSNAATTQANASFTFGSKATQAPKPGGFQLGNQAGSTSFSFGNQQATATTTTASTLGFNTKQQQQTNPGLTFGTPQQQPQTAAAGQTGGLTFGTPQTTQAKQPTLTLGGSTPAPTLGGTLGQTLGGTPGQTLGSTPAQSTTGFTLSGTLGQKTTASLTLGGTPALGAAAGTTPAAGATTTAGGLTGATPAATATPLGLGGAAKPLTLGATTTTTATGFSLGGTTTSSGLTLGAVKPTVTSSSFGSGLGGTTASTKPGLSFGTAATSASFGGLGGTTAVTTATGIFSATSATASTTAGGIFGSSGVSTANTGLGGVDPKTTAAGSGGSGVVGKTGDSKAVKETTVMNEIHVTVEDFKNYVKNQKSVREKILRMSSTPMYKVQEEVVNLKQLLSGVSNGLQRNAITIDKLKQDSAMELKHAEIAHRTKETPPGLQYEHTAPTEYFQKLVDGFESQMVFYRQQIEEMENHLTSLNQGTLLTPKELTMMLGKLHEAFVAMASQLQVIHEAVQIQRDHYLNYRRVFHGDNMDVFEKRKRAKDKTGSSVVVSVGPTPFSGLSNTAAVAVASTLNRSQQPTGLGIGAPTFGSGQTTNLAGAAGGARTGNLFGGNSSSVGSGFGASTGFGTATGFNTTTTSQPSTGFGASTGFNVGGASNTATIRPLGSTGTSLFGSATAGAQSNTSGFSFSQPAAGTGFGAGTSQTPATGGFGTTAGFGSQSANGTFQLQNPPPGSKRGKKQ